MSSTIATATDKRLHKPSRPLSHSVNQYWLDFKALSERSRMCSRCSQNARTSQKGPVTRQRSSAESSVFSNGTITSLDIPSLRGTREPRHQPSVASMRTGHSERDQNQPTSEQRRICARGKSFIRRHVSRMVVSQRADPVEEVSQAMDILKLSSQNSPSTLQDHEVKRFDALQKVSKRVPWPRRSFLSSWLTQHSKRAPEEQPNISSISAPRADADTSMQHLASKYPALPIQTTLQSEKPKGQVGGSPTSSLVSQIAPSNSVTTPSSASRATMSSRASGRNAMITPEVMRQIRRSNSKRQVYGELSKKHGTVERRLLNGEDPVASPLRWSQD